VVALCFTTSSFSIHKFQMIHAEIVSILQDQNDMGWGGERRYKKKQFKKSVAVKRRASHARLDLVKRVCNISLIFAQKNIHIHLF